MFRKVITNTIGKIGTMIENSRKDRQEEFEKAMSEYSEKVYRERATNWRTRMNELNKRSNG